MDFRISFMIMYFTILTIHAQKEDIAKRPLLLVRVEEKEEVTAEPPKSLKKVQESELKAENVLSDDHPSDHSQKWYAKLAEPPYVKETTIYKNVHNIIDNKDEPITYPENTEFFCLAEKDEEKSVVDSGLLSQRCLFSSTVNRKCEKEIKPSVQEAKNEKNEQIECSAGDKKGKLYNVGYACCRTHTSEGFYYPAVIHFHDIFDLCYDDKSEQILYIHYQILIPKFLEYQIFEEDRKWVPKQLSTDDYGIFGDAFEKRKTYIESIEKDDKYHTPVTLASPHHMALVQWKIPFFHYLNMVLIHKDLLELWNRFHEYIETMAAENKDTRFMIRSGVYYSSESNEEHPSPLAFWFLIFGAKELKRVGVVIHNLGNSEMIPEDKCLCKFDEGHVDPLKEVVKQWEDIPNEAKNHIYACDVKDMMNFIKY